MKLKCREKKSENSCLQLPPTQGSHVVFATIPPPPPAYFPTKFWSAITYTHTSPIHIKLGVAGAVMADME